MQGTTSDMIKAELPVGRTAVCRTLACLAVLLLVCGLFAGSALSEPLSGAAAKNFEASLYKMDAAEFGELRTLNASLLRQTYEELRERVDALLEDEKRRTWRQSWEIMRDGFVSVAISRPAPTLGAQAVFRAAECQEALAGYSRAARDWRMAVRLYESVARCYPGSVRADDALLACARLSLANLRDSRGAGAYIDWILEKYARADSAEGARALKDALGSGGSSARELAVKMSAHNAARTDAQAAASRKNAGKPAASSAAESRAKAGAASVKRSEEAAAARTAQRAAKRTRPAPAAAGQIVPALTVTIDAGHGGQDPGTMHNGVIERDVTLDVALRLGRILKESGFRVNYTRTTNRTVSLPDRAVYANSRGSDLFISIHVNANLSEKVRGLEVYYLDTAPSPYAPVLVAD
ncbi:MAG: N-acetylmuramoyl-L-alanine amidase, partial [Desulfovibrionaceae bacterium]|nr:N-acetylmuramoyl-L-alanine amidase [Desulfovibrionaceae bacterium]